MRAHTVPVVPFHQTTICLTQVSNQLTLTGVFESVEVPFHNCQKVFFPQHFAAPDTTAQAVSQLFDISVTPDVSQTTSTGVMELIFFPFPRFPDVFCPQHLAHHSVVIAQTL